MLLDVSDCYDKYADGFLVSFFFFKYIGDILLSMICYGFWSVLVIKTSMSKSPVP